MLPSFHPIVEVFPALSVGELDELAEDIRRHGQREPAVLWCGRLIDGRHRALACERLGIDLRTRELAPDEDPVRFALSANLIRRHLSSSQRAMIAARLATMANDQAPNGAGTTLDQAAESLNVGPRTVDRARAVLTHGSPALVAAVDSGNVSVSRAAGVARTVEPDRQMVAIASQPTECAHEWESDGNGSRFCVLCHVDHPDSPPPEKPAGQEKRQPFEAVQLGKARAALVALVRCFPRDRYARAKSHLTEIERILVD